MQELALIRTMLDKDFYENHKGIRCPDKIFSKDARKIKQTLDYAMDTYGKSITPTELEALFFVNNTSMTTANKLVFSELFQKVAREKPLSTDIADDVLSKLFQQVVGPTACRRLGRSFDRSPTRHSISGPSTRQANPSPSQQ